MRRNAIHRSQGRERLRKIYYIRRVGMIPGKSGEAFAGTPSLVRFDLKPREEETLAEKVDGFRLSNDRKKVLYNSKEMWGIAEVGKFTVGKDALAIGSISVKVDPRAEWSEILQEAWRINRDYFYDKPMHGSDWPAMRDKYAKLLPEVPTRADLNRVIRGMCSELAVGHSYLGGGDMLYEPKSVPVGLLGADYEVAEGRYRFKKVYGGLNWDPELKAPLVAPGVEVKAGEFLLAVDGEEITPAREIYAAFEDKVGKRVELKVGPRADETGFRVVVVEPIAAEFALRNRDWVEGNLRKVRERTGGRVAYVYVPNTADLGHAYFKRYFFPQVDKEAIIVDERFNGGGSVADYYIDVLRRPVVSYWAMRHGAPIRTPVAAIPGPKVMLIDETAGPTVGLLTGHADAPGDQGAKGKQARRDYREHRYDETLGRQFKAEVVPHPVVVDYQETNDGGHDGRCGQGERRAAEDAFRAFGGHGTSPEESDKQILVQRPFCLHDADASGWRCYSAGRPSASKWAKWHSFQGL